jgi:hypothetical protein
MDKSNISHNKIVNLACIHSPNRPIWTEQNWTAMDISIISHHIIVDIDYVLVFNTPNQPHEQSKDGQHQALLH